MDKRYVVVSESSCYLFEQKINDYAKKNYRIIFSQIIERGNFDQYYYALMELEVNNSIMR